MRSAIASVILAGLSACSGGAPRPAVPDNTGHGHPIGAVPLLKGTLSIQPPGWCGGARPPAEYQPPPAEPAANATLIVRTGGENSDSAPVTTITTGADGSFSAALTEGTYCLVLDDKKARPAAADPNRDQACLEQHWKTCDAVVTLPASAPTEIVRSNGCFGPCYRGPMPP